MRDAREVDRSDDVGSGGLPDDPTLLAAHARRLAGRGAALEAQLSARDADVAALRRVIEIAGRHAPGESMLEVLYGAPARLARGSGPDRSAGGGLPAALSHLPLGVAA